MTFSPQRVRFEFLSYLKEFDEQPTSWRIGCGPDAQTWLFECNGVDPEHDIWLWKPMLSARASAQVQSFFTARFAIPQAEQSEPGPVVFLFLKPAREESAATGRSAQQIAPASVRGQA